MSIYSDVKDEFGDAPAHPSREKFITYYGYASGKPLGEFTSKKQAEEAGAKSTEKRFDDEGYKAAKAAHDEHNRAVMDEWMKRLRAEHSEVNETIFDKAYALAHDRGHGSGHAEVEYHLADYVEFAVAVIAASKG